MKVFLTIVFIAIAIVAGISSWRNQQIDIAREDGRKAGYEVGYEDLAKVYRPKVESQKALYEKKIKSQKKDYERKSEDLKTDYDEKTVKAEEDGLATGKKDKLADANSQIENKAMENKVKGNWDAVLFEVKN